MAATFNERLGVFVPEEGTKVPISVPIVLKSDVYRMLCGYAEAECIGVDLAANELLRKTLEVEGGQA